MQPRELRASAEILQGTGPFAAFLGCGQFASCTEVGPAMRKLIADDDLTSRTVLAAALRREGHEVAITTIGLEAWQALQQPGAPELAILDWMMPGMDGLEVTSRVRVLQSERPPTS